MIALLKIEWWATCADIFSMTAAAGSILLQVGKEVVSNIDTTSKSNFDHYIFVMKNI